MSNKDYNETVTSAPIQSSSSSANTKLDDEVTTTLDALNANIPKLHTVDSFASSLSSKSYGSDYDTNNFYITKEEKTKDSNITKETTRELDYTSSASASSSSTDLEKDSKSDVSEEEEENDDNEVFPEGGKEAWIVVFGCFLGLVACFGLINTVGVIENYLQNHQLADQSSSTIGWIFSIMLFICFASCIFSGTYFDRNGFKHPMMLGSVLMVGGLLGAANSTKMWHFILSFSIVTGFGNGIVLSPLVSCPAHYFKRKRGTACALATVGGSVGGGLFPLMLRKFFSMESDSDPYYGFVWGIRSFALISLVLLGLSICLAHERLHAEDKTYEEESNWKHFVRVYIIQSFDAKAFRDMRYLTCVIGTCIGELSLTSVITYYGAYALSKGISQSDSYMLVMVINLTGIPGRWVPGALSDSFGRFNVAIGTLFLLGVVMLVGWLPFGNDLTSMYVISALYGFFSGSIFSLLPVCCGQISKTEDFGKRYSTMYFCVSFATLVGLPITGAIIGNKSEANYQHYKIFCAVTTLFSAACFVVSRYFAVGFKWKKF
ncbi:riboflavin transporter Mch5p [Monosporozyma servazzii]